MRVSRDQLKPSKVLLQEDKAAVWRGPMIMSALNTFIQQTAWGRIDILVIDMPPGTGEAVLRCAAVGTHACQAAVSRTLQVMHRSPSASASSFREPSWSPHLRQAPCHDLSLYVCICRNPVCSWAAGP